MKVSRCATTLPLWLGPPSAPGAGALQLEDQTREVYDSATKASTKGTHGPWDNSFCCGCGMDVVPWRARTQVHCGAQTRNVGTRGTRVNR